MTQLIKIAGWPETRGHVIFVHGLGGHAYDTWTHGKDPASLWPRWLAREIEGLSAWTLSYAAPPTNWLGTAMPLQDRAVGVLERLLAEPELAQGSLLFVCHSLGGLVVKQMLREANDQQQRRPEVAALLERVKGVVFIATPHTGSTHASLLDRLRLFIWPSTATQDLVKNDPNLRNLNVWYRNWSTGLDHRIFYETQDTSAGTIVDPGSADAGLPGVVPIPIDADHIAICKPATEHDLVYARTRDLLVNDILPESESAATGAEPDIRELPPVTAVKPRNWVPVALRLALVVVVGFLLYKGMEAVFWPTYPPVDVEAIIEKYQAQHREEIARLEADRADWEQQATAAVTALANLRGEPDAPPDIDQALAMLEQGQTKQAEAIFQALADQKQADIQEAAAAYRHLGALAFLNDTEQALTAYRRATELDPENAQGWNRLGHLLVRVGKLGEAEAAYHKVMALGEASHDQKSIAIASGNLGIGYRIRGDMEQAEEMFKKSRAIYEALGLKEGMAIAYGNLGIVYRIRGDLAQAEAMYKKALGLDEALGSKEGIAIQYGNLGNLYRIRGDLEQAEAMLKKSLAIDEALGSKEGMATQYGNLGVVYETRGDLKQAEEMYNKSLGLFQDIGAAPMVEKVQGWLAKLRQSH